MEANVSLGTKTRRAYTVSLGVPLVPSLLTTGHLSVYGLERDYSTFASCSEGTRGIKASVKV